MSGVKSWRLDPRQLLAKTFIRSKGRLPVSREEFATWLLEFDEFTLQTLVLVQQNFEDHLNLCVRPIIIQK